MDKYIVKKNETIEDIARRFNLKVTDLQSVNDTNLYEIKEGDEINIPFLLIQDFNYYVVEEGNTLRGIAASFGIDIEVLAHLNGFEIEDYIYPKQVLIVPKENVKIYITKKGDTLRKIEKDLGFNIDYILEDNPSLYLVDNQLIIERDKSNLVN